jgi:chemotaxis protein MotA
MMDPRHQGRLRRHAPVALLGGLLIACLSPLGLGTFLHVPSLLITLGGTALVTLATFPPDRLRALRAALREAMARDHDVGIDVEQVKVLARQYRALGVPGLEASMGEVRNPFLRRGLELLLLWDVPGDLRPRLEGEHMRAIAHYDECRSVLLTVGKLLPAFGLIGTLVSLVILFRVPGELTIERVGPSFSLAILTTLYGALLANGVVLPLETKLQTFIERRRLQFEIGWRATQLIVERAYPSVIDEHLGAFLGAEQIRAVPPSATPGDALH